MSFVGLFLFLKTLVKAALFAVGIGNEPISFQSIWVGMNPFLTTEESV